MLATDSFIAYSPLSYEQRKLTFFHLVLYMFFHRLEQQIMNKTNFAFVILIAVL